MSNYPNIPFFNYQAFGTAQQPEIMAAIQNVMSRGAFILQQDLIDFERNMAEFVGVKHLIGVANGTDAIILALRAAGIQPGDEVILPSHTYVATAAAVHFINATPVLAECGADHLITPAAIEAVVTSKTRAVIPVHLNGRTCAMDNIQAIANKHNLIIIEDAAQGIGSKYKGQNAGTFGLAGTFSFYPAKTLGCFGDGGAVLTNNDTIARKIRLLRDHGRDKNGEAVGWGLNSRLDNLQAAVLNVKLRALHTDIERRREIAARYHAALRHLDDLTLPPHPDEDNVHFDTYQNYELEAGQRDALRKHLANNGVRTIIQWGGEAVHQIKGLGFKNISLPFTEKMFTRCFLLPMNPYLSDEDVDYICQTIQDFYN